MVTGKETEAAALFELLRCMARALHGETRQRAVANGLLPIHAQVLAYLKLANRYSNTAQSLSEYLGQTKGTVSQTLKLLEAEGLIRRSPDSHDRRVTRLAVTAAGTRRLAKVESDDGWAIALQSLPAPVAAATREALTTVLREWQQQRASVSFGVCRSCAHFRTEEGRGFRCGLTGETLSTEDSAKICREHLVAAP